MKRVYFNHISSLKNAVLIISSFICLLIGTFELFSEPNIMWNKRISTLGSILTVVFFARMVFGKYYVGWNKVGITIRINSFMGKTFNFKDIKSTVLENGILTVVKKDEEKIELDLSEIEENDVEKITEILIENTIANNT
ncbi:hypothetical protein [Tenacibaculum sp. SG-28]|uniref:hypothetical protein n=1 Tax=Tenacibaculum sp. SG-28 TaxID=754426 RepID=UPI000CF3F09A|nr:hypothetical protein [Tenacibaculum sp. SG-28]PQJ18718.1 hypothetical protein BSU00_12650 [Tenacibaculum sp. SG-28]